MLKTSYIFKALFSLISIGLFISCHNENKDDFIVNFQSFLKEVNINKTSYTDEDWQIADQQFTELKDGQFPMWKSLLTSSEKQEVNTMIAKYQALKVKRTINDFKMQMEDVADQATTIINELSEDSTLLEP